MREVIMVMARVKQWLDTNLSKFISRKLLVFLIATALLIFDKVTENSWAAIAVAYVGVEGFADMAIRWQQGTLSKLKNLKEEILEKKDVG